MAMTYRIWDKASPINGCPADEALASLRVRPEDGVYLLCEGDRVCIVQTSRNTPYPAATIEESAAAHLAAIAANVQQEKSAEEQITELQLAVVELASLVMGGVA